MSHSINAVTGALIDNLENAGKVFPYNSAAVPTPIASLRVITKTFKQSKEMKAKGEAAKPNVMVRIPTAHITTEIVIARAAELAPFVVSYLQGVESKGIEDYLARGGLQVFLNTLTLDKVIGQMEEAGQSGLNGEQITSWFEDAISVQLATLLTTKLGLPPEQQEPSEEQKGKIITIIDSYLSSFVSLASGKTMMNVEQRGKLAKCLELTGAVDTVLGAKFLSRFDKMEAKEKEALDGLGDL
jgi:hypothetical protein